MRGERHHANIRQRGAAGEPGRALGTSALEDDGPEPEAFDEDPEPGAARPLGAFEIAPFGEGTFALAREAAAMTQAGKLVSVAGGGDGSPTTRRAARWREVALRLAAAGDAVVREGDAVLFLDETASAVLEGKMLDVPHRKQAERIVAEARAFGIF